MSDGLAIVLTQRLAERWVRTVHHECLDKLLIFNETHLRRVLDNCADEHGLTDPQMIEDAISHAADLLERTESSLLFCQINEATQVYRELPFTFKLGERRINGVMDVLFLSKYQRWTAKGYPHL